MNFADVEWAKGARVVAVFTCGTPPIRLAYDVNQNKVVPFTQMATLAATGIRAKYRPADSIGDQGTFDWACSDQGKHAFLRAYPDALAR